MWMLPRDPVRWQLPQTLPEPSEREEVLPLTPTLLELLTAASRCLQPVARDIWLDFVCEEITKCEVNGKVIDVKHGRGAPTEPQ